MAKMQIICSGCHKGHECTQKKFPLMLLKKIMDPENKLKMINVCVGFLCGKCSMKKTLLDEIKKNPALQNMGWRKALQSFRKKPKLQF